MSNQAPKKNVQVNQNVVSFYFTNIPLDISYVSLRQGFEVCGILEDVYLARKRNVNGGAFGFVRFGKVKDVEKLLKALNNVCFGDWKVVAKVASFVRNVGGRGEGSVRGEGEKISERGKNLEGEKRELGGRKVVDGDIQGEGRSKGLEGDVAKREGVVNRGEVEVRVEKRVHVRESVGAKVVVGEAAKIHIPKYTSMDQDVLWASRGVVATVLNGDTIPVLQRRIFDAGFENLDIIPLGADKVLLRTEDDSDVNLLLAEASEFFANFFFFGQVA